MGKDLRALVQKIGGGASGSLRRNLSREEARAAFESLLSGDGTDAQVAAFFAALRAKGATADELTGSTEAARARLSFPALPAPAVVLGTSRMGKFHTPPLGLAAAAAAAACGTPVLVLAAPSARGAGITLGDLWVHMVGSPCSDPGSAERLLQQRGLACWEPTLADPGWPRLLRIEEEIGLRSLPDIVIKLLAPPGCRLMVAAMAGPVLGTAGEALTSLGCREGVIVQGIEGSTDPSVRVHTRGLLIEGGSTYPLRVVPADFALECDAEPSYPHEDRLEAAVGATLQALLGMPGPVTYATLLSAALMLRLSGRARDLAAAVALAKDALESGAAQRVLDGVRAAARQ
ncbi:MAG: hypothetical protein EYC70_05450 [Planctomycetota bacterium]|nr:MAG: hypothetical protein EYC70_05450 [Planctomycetota bacterium]